MGAEFKMVGKVKASPTTELVLSKVIENGAMKGWSFNTYITSEKYTGFTKGTLIPVGAMEQFRDLVVKALVD